MFVLRVSQRGVQILDVLQEEIIIVYWNESDQIYELS